jgi:hypothetical protein
MPDFGIMRGFNEKLFGDKLVAGQLPTQLGIIGSQEVFDTDVDAIAFFDRVTAAGGTLSATEKLAVDTLVKQMKADGTWTPMKAIYPMVGASAAACAQNLKSSSFTGTFSSGWTFASTGVTGNGTSAFMNTSYIESVNSISNNLHLSVYSRTEKNAGTAIIGAIDTANIAYTQINTRESNTCFWACQNIISSSSTANLSSLGFFISNKTAANSPVVFIRNTKSTATTLSGNLLTIPYFIGARNLNGSAAAFTNEQCAFASIGDGLTDTQASNFYTAVQAFQTTLSRQV